jgi:hypothetical protein
LADKQLGNLADLISPPPVLNSASGLPYPCCSLPGFVDLITGEVPVISQILTGYTSPVRALGLLI